MIDSTCFYCFNITASLFWLIAGIIDAACLALRQDEIRESISSSLFFYFLFLRSNYPCGCGYLAPVVIVPTGCENFSLKCYRAAILWQCEEVKEGEISAWIVEQLQHLLKCWLRCIDLFNTLQKYIYIQNSRCLLFWNHFFSTMMHSPKRIKIPFFFFFLQRVNVKRWKVKSDENVFFEITIGSAITRP